VPFAMPGLIWNTMMSMSGGWFFVTLSEAISVGHTSIVLPGIGSYIAAAIEAKSLTSIFWAIGAMLVVILIFDQLLFRPLIAWADRFRIDSEPSDEEPESWALTMFRRSQLLDWLSSPFDRMMRWSYRLRPLELASAKNAKPSKLMDGVFYTVLVALGGYIIWKIAAFAGAAFSLHEVVDASLRGLATFARVVILIALASLIWTPIGIYVGLRPHLAQVIQPIAQFLAAFPANLVFPVAVSVIVVWNLNPDIWLSPLMVLGTQWYILFNVIAGASALPRELKDAASNFQVRGWLWWKKVGIPAVMPYYVTGAITASGGSWNAAVNAEVAVWGSKTLHAYGLGAYIFDATGVGDFHKIVVGVFVMSFYVVILNRLFWRPLYWYAERKFRLA